METTLKITVAPGQPIKAEVLGVEGSECLQLTAALKAHGTVAKFEPKTEFYAQAQTTVVVSVELGI